MTNFEKYMMQYGYIDHDGVELALTQMAYPDNYGYSVRYFASAIDRAGNTYEISWDLNPLYATADEDWKEFCSSYANDNDGACAPWDEMPSILEDESNACNWDVPASLRMI